MTGKGFGIQNGRADKNEVGRSEWLRMEEGRSG